MHEEEASRRQSGGERPDAGEKASRNEKHANAEIRQKTDEKNVTRSADRQVNAVQEKDATVQIEKRETDGRSGARDTNGKGKSVKVDGTRAQIDKSALPIGAARRVRDKEHLRYVAQQPCLVCGRSPGHAHHLRFAQPRALGRKVSDEWVVPLCATHHRALHGVGDEQQWWKERGIDPIGHARIFWWTTRFGNVSDIDGPLSSQLRAQISNPRAKRQKSLGSQTYPASGGT